VKAVKDDCPAVALLSVIAPTEAHRDFTSDVHVRLHCSGQFILIHCPCKSDIVLISLRYAKVYHLVRYLISGRIVEARVAPATRSMRQMNRRLQVPPPVKACPDTGWRMPAETEPARIGS
jgi:hypothetical protein